MSRTARYLLRRVRGEAANQYLWQSIEHEFGRGFMKSLRDQVRAEKSEKNNSSEKKRPAPQALLLASRDEKRATCARRAWSQVSENGRLVLMWYERKTRNGKNRGPPMLDSSCRLGIHPPAGCLTL